jgi:hypothetical protein
VQRNVKEGSSVALPRPCARGQGRGEGGGKFRVPSRVATSSRRPGGDGRGINIKDEFRATSRADSTGRPGHPVGGRGWGRGRGGRVGGEGASAGQRRGSLALRRRFSPDIAVRWAQFRKGATLVRREVPGEFPRPSFPPALPPYSLPRRSSKSQRSHQFSYFLSSRRALGNSPG